MVAARRPEALPDGFAAELVCLAWEEDGELLVRPGLLHLQRPLPVSRASISSLGPGPEGRAEAAPLCLSGFSCPPTARLLGRSQWKPLSHGTRSPHPRCWERGEGAAGTQPPGSSASRGFPDAPGEPPRGARCCRAGLLAVLLLPGGAQEGLFFQLSTSHLRAVPPAREFVPTSRMGRFCQTAWKPARLGVGSLVHSKLSHYTRLFS